MSPIEEVDPAGHQGKDRVRMSLKHLCVAPMLRLVAGGSRLRAGVRRPARRRGLRPFPEALEPRLALDGSASTYTWTALGDGTSFNDPNNWSHVGPFGGGVGVTGVPSLGSNLVFPPVLLAARQQPDDDQLQRERTAPTRSTSIQIDGSYTFTGNGVAVGSGIIVANPSFGAAYRRDDPALERDARPAGDDLHPAEQHARSSATRPT